MTWKIYRTDGECLPHDACPMAVAIRERRAIRGVEAIAERPDGTCINFMPYPTPVFDEDGNLAGAVNLLLDITERRRPEDPANEQVALPAPTDCGRPTSKRSLEWPLSIAGRDPDDHATIRFGDVVAFDDVMWRYPDFLARAEAAYRVLEALDLPG